jgi:hypothetical protein
MSALEHVLATSRRRLGAMRSHTFRNVMRAFVGVMKCDHYAAPVYEQHVWQDRYAWWGICRTLERAPVYELAFDSGEFHAFKAAHVYSRHFCAFGATKPERCAAALAAEVMLDGVLVESIGG